MRRGVVRICCCWPMILLIIFSLSCGWKFSEAKVHDHDHHHHDHQKLPNSAVVVGTVYCDTCFQDDFSKGDHHISGATVAVECEEGSSRPTFHEEVKTDSQGKFRVYIPFSVSKHAKEIEGCTVRLVKSGEPYCAVASIATSSLFSLKKRKDGKHIYSAGFFTFKPLKQPDLCNQQPSLTKSRLNSLGQGFFPNPQIPYMPSLPYLPQLPRLPPLPPLPTLPSLPSLPSLPPKTFFQKPVGTSEEADKSRAENGEISHPQFFFPPLFSPPSSSFPLPPNPFQPPPLLPNPFQPPSPPLIPNPFQPPSPPTLLPPLPNLPPIPGLTPSPPPPPPTLPFPFPPIRFPPSPFFPGIPPASINPTKMTP